jgi:hypothetical protein
MLTRKATLRETSNYRMKSLEGKNGTLFQEDDGTYSFKSIDGYFLNTNIVKKETILGDLSCKNCKEFSFETDSGSFYMFDLTSTETATEGVYSPYQQYRG